MTIANIICAFKQKNVYLQLQNALIISPAEHKKRIFRYFASFKSQQAVFNPSSMTEQPNPEVQETKAAEPEKLYICKVCSKPTRLVSVEICCECNTSICDSCYGDNMFNGELIMEDHPSKFVTTILKDDDYCLDCINKMGIDPKVYESADGTLKPLEKKEAEEKAKKMSNLDYVNGKMSRNIERIQMKIADLHYLHTSLVEASKIFLKYGREMNNWGTEQEQDSCTEEYYEICRKKKQVEKLMNRARIDMKKMLAHVVDVRMQIRDREIERKRKSESNAETNAQAEPAEEGEIVAAQEKDDETVKEPAAKKLKTN